MDVFAIVNVTTTQRRRCCANIPMNAFAIANVTTMQLGTSCSFDSPGLARDEPTPGSIFARRFNAVGVELFPRKHGYSDGINGGLRLESVTLTALKRVLHDVINVYTYMNKWQITQKRYNTYGVVPHT